MPGGYGLHAKELIQIGILHITGARKKKGDLAQILVMKLTLDLTPSPNPKRRLWQTTFWQIKTISGITIV